MNLFQENGEKFISWKVYKIIFEIPTIPCEWVLKFRFKIDFICSEYFQDLFTVQKYYNYVGMLGLVINLIFLIDICI